MLPKFYIWVQKIPQYEFVFIFKNVVEQYHKPVFPELQLQM